MISESETCESASWGPDWDDGHWTMAPWWSQRAQVSTVKLRGWITQLSQPRSDRQNGGRHRVFVHAELTRTHTDAAACL